MRHNCGVLVLLAVLALPVTFAKATIYEIGPGGDLQQAVSRLGPGDELALAGGRYILNRRLSVSVSGTEQAPIIIRAKDNAERPLIEFINDSQNVINVENSDYLTLRGLRVSGGSHGIRLYNARFVTVEDSEVFDTGDVAISANADGNVYQGLRLLRNHIHHTNGTGEGMYLGCNKDLCRVFDSLIEGNYIHHTSGPSVTQGDGIELKLGSYNNIIRDNVIHDTNYPCIIAYGANGNGGQNTIERNLMWGCGDHAVQVAADAIIRNNIVLGAAQNGIQSRPHQGAMPGNLTIVHNTVIIQSPLPPQAKRAALQIGGISGPVVIGNNALFAADGIALQVTGDFGQLTLGGNLGYGIVRGLDGYSDGQIDLSGDIGRDFLRANFSNALPQDVYPAPDSRLLERGDPALAGLAPDDFNLSPRNAQGDNITSGAYAYDQITNPGWPLAAGFKPLAVADPDPPDPDPEPKPLAFRSGFE